MREQRLLINGLEANLKIAGEGEPLLILHGWGGSSDSWIRAQELLAEEGFKVVVPDFPGFGKTKTPKKPWGLKDYSDFVFNLAEKTKLQNFFLLGHSFGGRIATKFAVLYPEKIKSLILCDSAGIKQKWGLKERLIFQLAKIGNALFTPKPLIRFKDKARSLFYIFLRHKDYVKANGTMKETIKKIFEEDLLPELPRVKPPTLIIWGEKDKLVPVGYAFVFKEKIKNSKLEILPKIGHSPHLEVPKKLSEIILNFLKKQNSNTV
jgi:pimeloyl-ACP methyl ester carboxylesterase